MGTRDALILFYDSGTRRDDLMSALNAAGCRVREVERLSSIVDAARALTPAAVLLGCSAAEERDILSMVASLRGVDRRLKIVLAAANGSEALAVAALRAGVADYYAEPIDCAMVAAAVARCAWAADRRAWPAGARERERVGPRRTADAPPAPQRGADGPPVLVGPSGVMRTTEEYLGKVAGRDVTVLITGETGTGKELAAALIHGLSPRRANAFMTVNCAAIPDTLLEAELFGHESGAFTGAIGARPGLLQSADRGTVFFDEVGDMGLLAQAKILRAIEAREVHRVGGKKPIKIDVRIVAATNQDLEKAVDEGTFRRDLYFRLNVARIHLPPLRERRGDIGALLDHYLREMNARCRSTVEGFNAEAIDLLQAYDWPGNVRELKNLVEAIFVSPPERRVSVDDLPPAFTRRLQIAAAMPRAERQRLLDALRAANWNKSQAAEMLHWSRMTVYRKMAKYSVLRQTEPTPASPPLKTRVGARRT